MNVDCVPDGEKPRIRVTELGEGRLRRARVQPEDERQRQHHHLPRRQVAATRAANNTLALTTVTYNLDTGEIYDADMELNSARRQFTTGHRRRLRSALDRAPTRPGTSSGSRTRQTIDATMYPDYAADVDRPARPRAPTTLPGLRDLPARRRRPDELRHHAAARLLDANARRSDRPQRPAAARRRRRRRVRGGGDAARETAWLASGARASPSSARRVAARLLRSRVRRRWQVLRRAKSGRRADRRARCAARTDAIALDVESNGLFAYRARLCTVQLALEEGDAHRRRRHRRARRQRRAARRRSSARRAGQGPPRSDLRRAPPRTRPASRSRGVRDTSVAARLLGYQATGLASLLGVGARRNARQAPPAARLVAAAADRGADRGTSRAT